MGCVPIVWSTRCVSVPCHAAPRNGVSDRVTVINKSSGALEAGVDVPSRGVDVVVTELVDSGLLGERIIPVLADARARGLLAEGGRVIPEVMESVKGLGTCKREGEPPGSLGKRAAAPRGRYGVRKMRHVVESGVDRDKPRSCNSMWRDPSPVCRGIWVATSQPRLVLSIMVEERVGFPGS